MRAATIWGKALVVLERGEETPAPVGGGQPPYRHLPSVTVFLQSVNSTGEGNYAADSAGEDLVCHFQLCGDRKYLRKTPTGGKVRPYVQYAIRYDCDYWGEWDFGVEVKSRVRRKQRPRLGYSREQDARRQYV